MTMTLREADLPGLEKVHSGKVRDVFALDSARLLMVASDRLSAFDVVLPDPIPGKGEILTRLSNAWFGRTRALSPNHLLDVPVRDVLPAGVDPERYAARSVVVRRLRALPVEAIARGYVVGSGWKEYERYGSISGIRLPAGLAMAEALAEPIFTPSTKAVAGGHDENIGFDALVALIGGDLAERVRATTLAIYRFAADFARSRGILIADTKLEFGIDADGTLRVMDEMLTPDSSRFWDAAEYRVGTSPPGFDKQFVRDHLEKLDWNKCAPGPRLPADVIAGTVSRYAEALRRLAD